jgi:murein DD-endopeptidase MepM/ murein hydrolase activator NlpD
VALETSAIAIDKFINRESETAFSIESPFQNNAFIESFKTAEASNAVSVKISSTKRSTPAVAATIASVPAKNTVTAQTVPEVKTRSVSAEFVAAGNEKDSFDRYIEYSVQAGDSLYNIAAQFGSAADLIKKANSLEDKHVIKAGQTLKVPLPASEMVYTVRPGDSLSKIASRFRIPLKSLIEENNLKSHMLMAEQQIRIPVKGIKSGLKMIKENNLSAEAPAKLELIKENKFQLIPEKKLAMVGVEKLQMAQAPASKGKIDFSEKDLLTPPPVVSSRVVSNIKPSAEVAAAPTATRENEKPVTAAIVAKASEAVETTASENKPVTHKVAKGDSLLKIAHRYNTTVAQIQQDNSLNGTMVKVGEEIKVTPNKKLYRLVKTERTAPEKKITVVKHKVVSGESLSLIARKYQTTISAIVAENNMSNTVVMAGQTLKVPTQGRYKVAQSSSKAVLASWKMPVRGRLSDKYGWRKHPVYRKRLFHAGIDIAAPKGTPIAAVQSGKVIYAGRRAGYGNLVIISHPNGMSTRYAHCSSILVKKGQNVRAGQLLAKVGATGVATGNHLHFEVRKNGKTQNPLTYLN